MSCVFWNREAFLMSQVCVTGSPWLVITQAGELGAFDSVSHWAMKYTEAVTFGISVA